MCIIVPCDWSSDVCSSDLYLNRYFVKLDDNGQTIKCMELTYNEKNEIIEAITTTRAKLAGDKYTDVYQINNNKKKAINFWYNHPKVRRESIVNFNNISKYNPNGPKGFMYLLQKYEFIKSGENIYKLGFSQQTSDERLRGYPKGSEYRSQIYVNDVKKYESIMKHVFSCKYKCRPDYGAEYFEGNIAEMRKDLNDLDNNVINLK
jgi:hypothetical protein